MVEPASMKLVLEELRIQMDRTFANSDALDQKANFLLGGAGIVIALVAALNNRLVISSSNLPKPMMLVIFALYILLVIIVILALLPARYQHAIPANWEILDSHLFTVQEQEATHRLVSDYIKNIQNNEKINSRKARAITLASIIFAVIIILLIWSAIN